MPPVLHWISLFPHFGFDRRALTCRSFGFLSWLATYNVLLISTVEGVTPQNSKENREFETFPLNSGSWEE